MIEALKKSLCGSFQKMLGLSCATEFYGTEYKQPKFIVNMGTDCFTNNDAIVIGLKHPSFQWCKDKDDLYENADYVKGHEIQHIKSTTDKAWNYAINRGAEIVIEETCKKHGIRMRFSTENDYNKALSMLKDKGIYLNLRQIRTLTHFITNSLEDGRIEAIRASENAVFKKQMLHIRLRNWSDESISQSGSVENMNSLQKLQIILNQVLTLSTCSVYEKGFMKLYAGTELHERVLAIIPNIKAAVTAPRCRYMAEESIKISESLADMISDAATLDADFVKFIEALSKMISEAFEPKTKEEQEAQGNTGGTLPFGFSDLTIEIEGNKEDEDTKENASREVKGNKKSDESGTGNEKEDDKNGKGSNANDTKDAEEQTQSGDSSGKGSSSGSKQKSGGESGTDNTDTSKSREEIEAEIEADMEKAAKEASGMAHDNAQTAEAVMNKQEEAQSMKEDETEPLKKTDENVVSSINAMYDTNYTLVEKERKYEVDSLLPPEMVREIDALYRKLESLFTEAKKRYRKYIMQGRLDSSRVAMLAANEINVFKETKISKGVKACAEIILDNSGSMGYGRGSKREYACKALTKIEMVFAKAFPIKIFAFDASGGCIVHEIIKGWNERFSRSAAWNFLEKGRYGNSNFDGYSIRVATADILSRPEKKKLLVVLSDGLPCYGGEEDVKQAVTEARLKGVEVVGIYFSEYEDAATEESFKRMYQKNYIITSPDNIEKELVVIMKKFFS